MAVLAPPFVLCPFTEGKELLGFSKDQAENKIIFTLGKNIAIRYSVKEQKQEISWTLKIHWFTSKVVFCPDIQRYGAVVDDAEIFLWKEEDTSLQEPEKYKCPQPVYGLVPTNTCGTLVVFKNGTVTRLSDLKAERPLRSRNELFDENTRDILDICVDEDKSLLFIISAPQSTEAQEKIRTSKIGVEKKKALYIHIVNIPTAATKSAKFFSLQNEVYISLEEMGKEIIGWCILSEAEPSILYLLSDGTFLKQKLLPKQKEKQRQKGQQYHMDKTVTEISRFHKFINTEYPVVIKPCAESTIVVYGCNPSEEGAVVLIYDLKYDLVLSTQSLKLYSPIMTKLDNNLFIPLGLNILVMSIRIKKSLLSSVVGQHRIEGTNIIEVRDPWKSGWEQDGQIQPVNKQVTVEETEVDGNPFSDGLGLEDLESIVKTLEKNGHPESLICAQVIHQTLEKFNHPRDAFTWILEYFDDIPEDLLVAMLVSTLSGLEKNSSGKNVSSNGDSLVEEQSKNASLMNGILKRTFDRHELVKNLRVMDYNLVKNLLEHINESMDKPFFMVDEEDHICNENSDFMCNVMKWAGALLDAHYTHFVFHNDTAIVDKLLRRLEEKTIIMKELEQIEPLVKIIRSKTKYEPMPNPNSIYRVSNVVFR